MAGESDRPDPQIVKPVDESLERRKRRGRLKVFLGYAPGVGKSFQMIDEGRRRRQRGENVVVGAVQQDRSPKVEEVLAQLEVVPPLTVNGQSLIDIERLLQRRPEVVLIDGLAYDNPPGCRNPKRCADLEELLDAGISVVTTVNLQYIEEYQDAVQSITGARKPQSVPRSFVEHADEIVVVDAAAHDESLSRLRQMALLLAADVVDLQLEDYLQTYGIRETLGVEERILVCITPRSNAAMIESGRRNADRSQGEFYVVYVRQAGLTSHDQSALEKLLAIARDRRADVRVLDNDDPAEALVDFAREVGITQIFIGHSLEHRWLQSFHKTTVERLIKSAEGIDVRIFPQ